MIILKKKMGRRYWLKGLVASMTMGAVLFCIGCSAQAQETSYAKNDITAKEQLEVVDVVTVPAEWDWKLRLVNEANPLPSDFDIETKKLSNGKAFDARAYDQLVAMLEGAKAEGVSLVVVSAYRTVSYQEGLFKRKVDQYKAKGYDDAGAYAVAKTIVALPGTSEHNLGLAADIVTPSYQVLDEGFENTEAFTWLQAHAMEYGFVMRYPKDKSEITGIIYEPWHYRYVGTQAAKEMTEQGVCLEEYLQTAV